MINQVSVFLENKAGQLLGITKSLSAADINIRAINVAETTEYGVIRLVVDDHTKAVETLTKDGFIVSLTQVVAVVVPDVSGGLSLVLNTISKFKINVEYMYSMLDKKENVAYMVFKVEEPEAFEETVRNNGLKTV